MELPGLLDDLAATTTGSNITPLAVITAPVLSSYAPATLAIDACELSQNDVGASLVFGVVTLAGPFSLASIAYRTCKRQVSVKSATEQLKDAIREKLAAEAQLKSERVS